LAADKRPNLINLNTLRRNVADRGVLVIGARLADLRQQPENGSLGDAGHAGNGADGATLHQPRDHRNPLRHGQLVHDSIIPYRFSMSIAKRGLSALFAGFSGDFLFSFGPSRFGRIGRYLTTLLFCHRYQTALASDPAALASNRSHDARE